MSEIKTVSISGTAAKDITGGAKKGRRSTKKKQEGGSDEPIRGVSSVMNVVRGVESTSSFASTSASPNSHTWLKYPADAPVPPVIKPTPSYVPSNPNNVAAPTAPTAPTLQQGGDKKIRVELKKKHTAKKVHLNPKKVDSPKIASKKHQTKKARKVSIGVSSLHKRITRAKKLHKNVKDMPLTALKDKLIKKGLIKSTSKAPESVLRQIAADSEVVANKAL
jgi:hypothetical protein